MHMLDQDNQRTNQAKRIINDPALRERQQFIAVLVMFVIVAIIIGALYLVQATTNISNARDIQNLSEQRDRLEREIEGLRAENAELLSLQSMYERATTLGFVTAGPDSIQYIVVDGYVYDLPAPTLTPVLITATPQIYEDNFAGWLQRQFDALRNQFDNWGEE